jgi:hypothetical protein
MTVVTYWFLWQSRRFWLNESIYCISVSLSCKSKIFMFSCKRDLVTDFGIVAMPRCTCNELQNMLFHSLWVLKVCRTTLRGAGQLLLSIWDSGKVQVNVLIPVSKHHAVKTYEGGGKLNPPLDHWSVSCHFSSVPFLMCNALQAGRSRVRFPMMSLEFFIDIILSVALWLSL